MNDLKWKYLCAHKIAAPSDIGDLNIELEQDATGAYGRVLSFGTVVTEALPLAEAIRVFVERDQQYLDRPGVRGGKSFFAHLLAEKKEIILDEELLGSERKCVWYDSLHSNALTGPRFWHVGKAQAVPLSEATTFSRKVGDLAQSWLICKTTEEAQQLVNDWDKIIKAEEDARRQAIGGFVIYSERILDPDGQPLFWSAARKAMVYLNDATIYEQLDMTKPAAWMTWKTLDQAKKMVQTWQKNVVKGKDHAA